MSLPQIELLTLDIYVLRHLSTFNDVVARARRRGKTVYIEETWRPGRFEPTPGREATPDEVVSASIGSEAYQAVDIKWLRAMTLYAASLGLEAVTPFWTQTFFAYVPEEWSGLDPRYNRRVIEAVRRGERTQTYEALVTLIREHGAARPEQPVVEVLRERGREIFRQIRAPNRWNTASNTG